MKRNVLIYPYDREAVPLLRYSKMIENMLIKKVVSPNGWGFHTLDAGRIDGGEPLDLMVESDFETQLECCDTVLFSDHEKSVSFEHLIIPKIKAAMTAGKDIICAHFLPSEVKEEISKQCRMNKIKFDHFPSVDSDTGNEETAGLIFDEHSLVDIQTPVIFVLGTGEKTHKFEIQLLLRNHFLEKGYRVSQIGSRCYSELFGFHSFPKFMETCHLSESQKIVNFNRLVKKMEQKEDPDIIIIGIPGGVLPFDNFFTNRFGITAFEVSTAITPDAVVLSTYYENIESDALKNLIKETENRLGLMVDALNIANVHFDWMASKREKKRVYTTLESAFIEKRKQRFQNEIKTPLYNIHHENDARKIAEDLINILGGYGQKKIA